MPATPTAVNMNHCTAYQKCGPSESSGRWIGLEAALLPRLHGQQADVARRNWIRQRSRDGIGVDQTHLIVNGSSRGPSTPLVAAYVSDQRHLTGWWRRGCRRDLSAAYPGNESAIHEHGAGCSMQRSHDLVAVGITIAAVARHELMIGVEGAARLDSLPLISVGDRAIEDLARTAESAFARWRSSSRCVRGAEPVGPAATHPG